MSASCCPSRRTALDDLHAFAHRQTGAQADTDRGSQRYLSKGRRGPQKLGQISYRSRKPGNCPLSNALVGALTGARTVSPLRLQLAPALARRRRRLRTPPTPSPPPPAPTPTPTPRPSVISHHQSLSRKAAKTGLGVCVFSLTGGLRHGGQPDAGAGAPLHSSPSHGSIASLGGSRTASVRTLDTSKRGRSMRARDCSHGVIALARDGQQTATSSTTWPRGRGQRSHNLVLVVIVVIAVAVAVAVAVVAVAPPVHPLPLPSSPPQLLPSLARNSVSRLPVTNATASAKQHEQGHESARSRAWIFASIPAPPSASPGRPVCLPGARQLSPQSSQRPS